MVQLAEKISMEPRVDTLLSKSLELYQEVEKLYQSIPTDMSPHAILKVMRMVGTMNALLQDARELDTQITEALDTGAILSESIEAQLRKRDEILQRLYQDNQSITKKAENVKSLLHHEISSLSTGHHAIKGYKQAGTDRQYIVRDSF